MLRGIMGKIIKYDNLIKADYCDTGLKAIYKVMDLDINKAYDVEYIKARLEGDHVPVLFEYINDVIAILGKDALVKLEPFIANESWFSYDYAMYALEGRFEKGEKVISNHPDISYFYALDVIKGRFELGEEAISSKAEYAYRYARDVLKDRFKLGEEGALSKDPEYAYQYARVVLKGRFIEGEDAIRKSKVYSILYDRIIPEKG